MNYELKKMKLSSLRHTAARLLQALMVTIAAIGATSCQSLIYEDLDPCDEGLRLRFIYDYNMEFANGFPAQVDCLTLLVYDANGKYLMTKTVTDRTLLGDENWRMTIDLPAGKYHLVAYGGMADAAASFAFQPQPGDATPMRDVQVYLKPDCITDPVGTKLHDLFFGALDVTVTKAALDYTDATVEMMKDTNNLRIVLQHVDGTPVNNKDFDFAVTAANTLFDYNNNLLPTATTTFCPWARDQQIAGAEAATDEAVEVAYAEFSLSRLMATGGPRLTITSLKTGDQVLSIPLVSYLLLLKSQEYAWMPSQEFLDRESRWSMIFFLDRADHWWTVSIIINGWTVRINDIIG